MSQGMETKDISGMSRRKLFGDFAVAGASMIASIDSHAQPQEYFRGGGDGDASILRFLAAAEILETDAWQQYHELASGNPAYKEALEVIDDDNPEYVEQNTDDEFSHADFINAYLRSTGR